MRRRLVSLVDRKGDRDLLRAYRGLGSGIHARAGSSDSAWMLGVGSNRGLKNDEMWRTGRRGSFQVVDAQKSGLPTRVGSAGSAQGCESLSGQSHLGAPESRPLVDLVPIDVQCRGHTLSQYHLVCLCARGSESSSAGPQDVLG